MTPEKNPRSKKITPRKVVEIPPENPEDVKRRDGVPEEYVGRRPMRVHYSPLHSGDHWSKRASIDDPPDRK